MVAEIKVWILLAVASMLAAVIGFMIKVVTSQVLKRLDAIVSELKQLTKVTTVHREQIKSLQEHDAVLYRKLHNHSLRIRNIEQQLPKTA